MNKIINFCLLLGFLFTSCNDSFLDKLPLNKETPDVFFNNPENLKSYAWQFYAWYPGYDSDLGALFELNTDNGYVGFPNYENYYSFDRISIAYYMRTGSQGWHYGKLRAIQTMIDNLYRVNTSEVDREHWRSLCYFFKAQEYFGFLANFGQAIWIDKVLTDADTDVLYGPAIGRKELAEKIYEMLKYAHDHIRVNGDGPNTVNKNVVNALISRFGLFEGTYEKYHQIADGNPEKYLKISYDASAELMKDVPHIASNYNDIFNSYDITGVQGVLLHKKYESTSALGHSISRSIRSSASIQEATADLIQSYLCSDGRPIWTSEKFEGDHETGNAVINVEFRNRDHRLYYTICPPYRIILPDQSLRLPQDADKLQYTDNPMDREYIDLMNELAPNNKWLPLMQWNDLIVREIPHFHGRYSMGQGFNISNGGYYIWKYYVPENQQLLCGTDAPIFRMGEVLVNHAEAAWELGLFDQSVADQTINRLRERAHVAPMIVGDITADFDPHRDRGGHVPVAGDDVQGPQDYEVDPVLWEIRRERRVELAFEMFRFGDLRRWAKGHYTNKVVYGAYVKKADYENERYVQNIDFSKFDLKIEDMSKDEGRITFFGKPTPGWTNKFYLNAIPINDLLLNTNLVQSPGYSTGK